jgi:hypothetical protein
MDQHFQIKTPIDLLQLRTMGVNDGDYGANIWNPNHASALLQGEWLQPTATYNVLTRLEDEATPIVIATHGGVWFPVLDPQGQYDQQAQPGTYGGCSVVYSGTFECYTDRISTEATAASMTIGTPVGLSTNTLDIAGGTGATVSSRCYLDDSATIATELVVGWVVQPYSATTGYVGVLMQIGHAA